MAAVGTLSSGLSGVAMGVRTTLRRIGTRILGVVDEYWAMREPGQYGDQPPQCQVRSDNAGEDMRHAPKSHN